MNNSLGGENITGDFSKCNFNIVAVLLCKHWLRVPRAVGVDQQIQNKMLETCDECSIKLVSHIKVQHLRARLEN